MRSPLHALAFVTVALGVARCGGAVGDETPLDRADPNLVTWVAPTMNESIRAGDVVLLTVSTTNAAATAIDFAVDGTSVGSCDAITCMEGGLWSVATAIGTEGTHTLTASYGSVSVTRTITVLPMSTVTGAVTPGSATEMDPTVGEVTTPAQSPGEPDLYPEVPTSPMSGPPDPGVEDLLPDEIGVPSDPLTADHPTPPRGFLDPSHSFDNNYNGRLYAVQGQRILLHRGRLLHDDNNVAECMAVYGDAIARYADNQYISRASIYGLLWAETQCFNPDVDAEDSRAGALNISASMCMAVDPMRTRAECLSLLHDQPSYAIDVAVRFLASDTSRHVHHNDPVRLAALFRSGSLRSTNANPWHLVSPPEYLTHFVEGYNAYRLWEAHANPAPVDRPVFVGSTGRLQRGNDVFMAKGISLMGLALTPARDTDTNYQGWVQASLRLRDHRAQEFTQWHNWNANLLRLQISQDGLDPMSASYDANYRARIIDTVSAARQSKFVVIVSMRNNMPGRDQLCMPDYPCDVTRRAWAEVLGPRDGVASPIPTDRGVLLELYNEPNGGNDVVNNGHYWEEWRPPHRQIVNAVRDLGSHNVLIVDGVRAGKFAPLDGFELDDPNVVYGLHPYPLHADIEYTRPSDLDSAFGNRCGHVPCLATEWSTSSDDHCYDNQNNPDHWSPHLSRTFQMYLRSHRIGTVMWPGDFEGSLVYIGSGDRYPTTLTRWGDFRCDDDTHERHLGPGRETRYYFQHHRRLPGE